MRRRVYRLNREKKASKGQAEKQAQPLITTVNFLLLVT